MSVFNQNYSTLLEDGLLSTDKEDIIFHYMKRLKFDGFLYNLTYRYNWWDKVDEWVIEIVR